MSKRYDELKKRYDDIGKRIAELHQEQQQVRNQMMEACTHEDLIRLDPDPFLVELGVEDDEIRFKCRNCFEYFSQEEVAEMRKKKDNLQ